MKRNRVDYNYKSFITEFDQNEWEKKMKMKFDQIEIKAHKLWS